jgi:hypothetical protein
LKATRNVIGYGDAVSKIARRKLEKEARDEEGEEARREEARGGS